MQSDFQASQIIWSADVSRDKIKHIISSNGLLKGTVFKLDRLFFENNSKNFIDFCQDAGYPVFADAKIVEIPSKSLEIAQTYLKHKPWMLNIMAGACSTGIFEDAEKNNLDALKRFADACQKAGTKSCAVTVLTSKSDELCREEFHGRSPLEQVLAYVEMLIRAGFTDVVCSPKEARAIREEFGDAIDINTPGIRLPKSDTHDQKRVTTPHQAFEAGATRIVVGRDLTGDGTNLKQKIGARYGRLIENIQMNR